MKKYKIKRVKPSVKYSSSLLQQNHGEKLKGHGMLVWDVSTRSSEFVEIENDYGFHTLYIEDGKLSNTSNIPKNPSLRVNVINTSVADTQKIVSELKSIYDVQELTISRLDTLSQQKKVGDDTILSYTDIQNVEHQNSLIRDYLLKYYEDISDEILGEIFTINRQLNTKISEDEVGRDIQWIPKKFEFSNMFSYGESNSIDFTKLRDVNGLFGENASGKSSVFDALSFCIFDKCSRAYKGEYILNNKKNKFSCTFNFEINGVDYFIEKIGVRQKKGNVKVDVQFYRLTESGDIENLNGEQRRETNLNIKQYLGTYEDFIFTCLSLQGNNSLFTAMSQSERKDLLTQLMGLGIFDKLYSEASGEIKDVSALIKKFKKNNTSDELSTLKTDNERLKRQSEEINNTLDELKSQLKSVDNDINNNYASIVSVGNVDTDINKLNTLISETRANIEAYPLEIQNYTKKLQDSISIQAELETQLQNVHVVKSAYETHLQHKKKYDDVVQQYNETNYTLKHHQKLLEKIKESLDIQVNDSCDACSSNVARFNKDYTETVHTIEELTSKIGVLHQEKDSLGELVDDTIEKQWLELKNIHSQFKTVSRDIKYNETQLKLYGDMLIAAKDKITMLEDRLTRYHENEDAIVSNNKIYQSIERLKSEKYKIDHRIKSTELERDSIVRKLGAIEVSKQNIIDNIKEVQVLEKSFKVYEYYLDAIKRDGIPYELIQKIIPVVESEVNTILQQIVNFTVNIDIDGKNINAKIVYDDREWSLELASGMEKFVSGIAIRVALMRISNLPRPNFIVLDEGFGALDSDNLNSMFMLFQYLKTQFTFIIIISHLDSIRDVADEFIEIKKDNGFSKLNYF